jgi:predicted nuclease of restriction endonuclease-like RecB superfamily
VLGRGDSVGRLVLRSGDPIMPARELPPCDSKLEERFAKAFGKIAPEWDIVREPVGVAVGDGLIFPDFELRHRATGERWLLEILGYWTVEYVQRKLDALRAAKVERLILCIDEARGCTAEALAVCDFVLPFRRHVDAKAVLAVVDPRAHAALPASPPSTRRRRGGLAGEL